MELLIYGRNQSTCSREAMQGHDSCGIKHHHALPPLPPINKVERKGNITRRSFHQLLTRYALAPCNCIVQNVGAPISQRRLDREKKQDPHGHAYFAVSRCANSSWNMITAQRNIGRCANNLNSKGDDICAQKQYHWSRVVPNKM